MASQWARVMTLVSTQTVSFILVPCSVPGTGARGAQ